MLLASPPYRELGRQAEADDALRRGLKIVGRHLELNPDDARALYLGAIALCRLGQNEEKSLEWGRRALAIDSEDPAVLYNVGCLYSVMGRVEDALACLEKAVENGFGHREWFEHDSDLDSLRGDPRFQALLKRV